MVFKDRTDAGQKLAVLLAEYRGPESIVYALPRGGIVVGAVVARCLGTQLDLLIPRKVGHPLNPEYAIAAVSEDGQIVTNPREMAGLDLGWFASAVAKERLEARRRRYLYLGNRPRSDPSGKVCIVVDDGIATGLTVRAALAKLKSKKPGTVVVAVPVAPEDAILDLKGLADRVVTVAPPGDFLGSVGAHYERFEQVQDETVTETLTRFQRP